MANWRDAYRNPSPPPGYVYPEPIIELKDEYQIFYGVKSRFFHLLLESGILEDPDPASDFDFDALSTEDEEVEILPVLKEPPLLIDLEEDEEEEATNSIQPSSDSNAEKAKENSVSDTANEKEASPSSFATTRSVQHTSSSGSTADKDVSITRSEAASTSCTTSNNTQQKSSTDEIADKAKEMHLSIARKEMDSPPSSFATKSIIHKSSVESAKKPKEKKKKSAQKRESTSSCLVDYSSDDSTYSSNFRKTRHKKKKKRSPSPHRSFDEDSSEFEDKKWLIKEEESKYSVKHENNNLYGRWFCEVCSIPLTSELTFQSHMQGKRHNKAVAKQNIPKAISDSLSTPAAVSSLYPQSSNIYRIRNKATAISQEVIEQSLKQQNVPCPGLHNVIEIQGLSETTYLCELCNARCATISIVPHLIGFKHQLKCLEYFEPHEYNRCKDMKKKHIEKRVYNILKNVQKSKGFGKLTVEKEYYGKPEKDVHRSSEIVYGRREDMPGPSRIDPEDKFPDATTLPNTSKNDFYCKICDAHMNNTYMWEAHIRGKRHLTNVKKKPGEAPSKTKTLHMPNATALVMDEIELVEEPVVGLDYIRETQNPEVSGAQYNCFLCGACMTHLDVIDHIVSYKHKIKFLEAIKDSEMAQLKALNLSENRTYSVIDELCAKHEDKNGRGNVEVYVIKSALVGGARW